jgi:hypothetical protein
MGHCRLNLLLTKWSISSGLAVCPNTSVSLDIAVLFRQGIRKSETISCPGTLTELVELLVGLDDTAELHLPQ